MISGWIDLDVQICHMSETHFRRKFSEYMRITPGGCYINLLRVKKVCELLHYTDCSIGDAEGIQAGFQTDSAADPQFFVNFAGTNAARVAQTNSKRNR